MSPPPKPGDVRGVSPQSRGLGPRGTGLADRGLVARPSPARTRPPSRPRARTLWTFEAKLTAYKPEKSRMEGGLKDKGDRPILTLQDAVDRGASYVSVAGDPKVFGYGTELRIPSLEAGFKKAPIHFLVVDTGGAFHGGEGRLDIAVTPNKVRRKKDRKLVDLNEVDPRVNDTVDVIVEHLVPPGSEDDIQRRLPAAFQRGGRRAVKPVRVQR